MIPTDSKARKGIPLYSGLVRFFPRALAAVARCSYVGAQQHQPGAPLQWDPAASPDNLDCLLRHLADDAMGVREDVDGVDHLTKAAWRCLAALEVRLREGAVAQDVTRKT